MHVGSDNDRDKLGRRGPLVFFGMLLWWVFAVSIQRNVSIFGQPANSQQLTCRLLIYSHHEHTRYAILMLTIAVSSI